MSPSTSLAWTVPRTRGNACTAADGEGGEQMREGGEQMGGEQMREGNSTGEVWKFALIFNVLMNMLAVT